MIFLTFERAVFVRFRVAVHTQPYIRAICSLRRYGVHPGVRGEGHTELPPIGVGCNGTRRSDRHLSVVSEPATRDVSVVESHGHGSKARTPSALK